MRIAIAGEAPCELAPIRQAIRRAARPYGLPRDAEVHVAFVSDAEMRALNKRFRRIDKTTDVLSFGDALPRGAKGAAAAKRLRAGRDGVVELGDVVISGPQAARQARRRRWPLATEVAFLAAHGTLHLLGFDDTTTAGYREMVALGTAALAQSRQRRVKR